MSDLLQLEKVGHCAIITMNNPPANTWTYESLSYLRDLVLELNNDKEIYSLIISSDSEKFFSAGADLKLFADGDKQVATDMSDIFGEAFETLSAFRGVSIAAITGWAMGGGLEVALACDLRICEEHAVLALPEASVGLLPCAGGTQNLAWLVGEGWAKRMILCGQRVDANLAERIGLIEEVVPTGTVKDKALALANMVQKQSPSAVTACKSLIQRGRSGDMASALPDERQAFVDLFDTEDQKEGVSAFLEKRRPQWLNR